MTGAATAANLAGRWSATLRSAPGVEIPFRLDISTRGDKVIGTLHSGRDPKTTSSAIMLLSARNQLEGKVVAIMLGDIMAHVVVKVGKNHLEV